MNVQICHDLARLPEKTGPNDIGYDLRCVEEIEFDDGYYTMWCGQRRNDPHRPPTPLQNAIKPVGSNHELEITLYDTGIKVEPPTGYYCEIVPKTSIVEHGVMMANGVGIVDPSYRGTLKVCLVGETLKCPFNLFQLILRPIPPDFKVTKVKSISRSR